MSAPDGRRAVRLAHRREREFRPPPGGRRMAQSGARLRQHALQPARPDQYQERRPASHRLDIFRRRVLRPRGRAARRRQHDVRRDALPRYRLRARPHQAGRADQIDLPDQPLADGDRQGVLRRGHPRLGLRQGQAHLQHARRPHDRARRRKLRRLPRRRWTRKQEGGEP